jgi:hypothetical protein
VIEYHRSVAEGADTPGDYTLDTCTSGSGGPPGGGGQSSKRIGDATSPETDPPPPSKNPALHLVKDRVEPQGPADDVFAWLRELRRQRDSGALAHLGLTPGGTSGSDSTPGATGSSGRDSPEVSIRKLWQAESSRLPDTSATTDSADSSVKRSEANLAAGPPPTGPTEPRLVRQFVYGLNYIDEQVAQLVPPQSPTDTSPPKVRYVLQDDNYNVVGIARSCDGKLIRQFRYGPYGEIVAAEAVTYSGINNSIAAADATTAPESWHLFQGLWYDPETVNAAAGHLGMYHNRTRYVPPHIGRFHQRDPNETGLLVATAMLYNARTPEAFVSLVPGAQYSDGLSPYQYLASNPVNRTDPMGLEMFDWMAESEDFESEMTGHKLYVLGTLNENARWASLGLQTSLDIASSLLGVDVFQSVVVLASGQGGFWESMDIFMSVAPFGFAAKVGGKLYKAAAYARKAKGGLIALDKATALASLAKRVSKHSEKYKNAVKAAEERYPKKAGKKEWHHIVPKYLGGPEDGPTVEVNAAYHQLITNEFQTKWGSTQELPPSASQLKEFIKEVYDKYPLPE